MTVSAPHARWLALIRYQTFVALDQGRQPAPMATLAINGLQDAVEAMLRLTVEHRSIALKSDSFVPLLDAVMNNVPSLEVHRPRMIALNKARVGFKHHGIVVDKMTITHQAASVQTFLEDAAREALGVEFEHTTMTQFIADEATREQLEAAKRAWDRGEHRLAMSRLRLAFQQLIEDYESRKQWHPGWSLFQARPLQRQPRREPSDGARLRYAEEWLEELDRRMRLLAIGVDMRRYAYLDAHAPLVFPATDGMVRMVHRFPLPKLTSGVFRHCQRFIIDTALYLGDGDYAFDPLTDWRSTADESHEAVVFSRDPLGD